MIVGIATMTYINWNRYPIMEIFIIILIKSLITIVVQSQNIIKYIIMKWIGLWEMKDVK